MAGTGTRKMGNAKAPAKAVRGQTSTNKRVAVGSKNTTSAKTVKATVTPSMQKKADTLARANRNADKRDRLKAQTAAQQKAGKGVIDSNKATRSIFYTKKFAKGGNI